MSAMGDSYNKMENEQEPDWKALAGELADVLQFIKRGNDCWCIANTADKRLGLHTHECNEVRLALAKYDRSVREQQEKGV
jgi:NTP pyrophosphatase (non-canonical NTP hydrolase)